jgi:hypothetical protein
VVPVLAEEGATTFPQLVTPLLGATVAAVVLWLVALLVVAFATRPRDVDPGPATMDLGEEPPAVVDLLTNDWRVTADAIPATLLDLAPVTSSTCSSTGRAGRCAGSAGPPRMAWRPTSAWSSTTSPGWPSMGSSRPKRSPQARRTSRPDGGGPSGARWSGKPRTRADPRPLEFAGQGVAASGGAGAGRPRRPARQCRRGLDLGTIGVGLVIWALLTSSMKLFGDQRDTPAGAEAAARWLGVRSYHGRNEEFPTLPPASVAVWDRYLGYAATPLRSPGATWRW